MRVEGRKGSGTGKGLDDDVEGILGVVEPSTSSMPLLFAFSLPLLLLPFPPLPLLLEAKHARLRWRHGRCSDCVDLAQRSLGGSCRTR